MKNDPYSTLGGLDQLLFKDNVKPAPTKNKKTSTSTRANGDAGAHSRDRSLASTNESTSEASRERSPVLPIAPAIAPASEPPPIRGPEPAIEAVRTRASAPTGHRIDARISGARHSHDLFQDQVRWINRIKVDLEETYGKRITGNDIVQLALDIFISDYETNGDDSALISKLVLAQPGAERGGR